MKRFLYSLMTLIAFSAVQGSQQEPEFGPKAKKGVDWTFEFKNNTPKNIKISISTINDGTLFGGALLLPKDSRDSIVRFNNVTPNSDVKIKIQCWEQSCPHAQPITYSIRANEKREHIFLKLDGNENSSSWKLLPQEGGWLKAKFSGNRYSTSGVNISKNVQKNDISRAELGNATKKKNSVEFFNAAGIPLQISIYDQLEPKFQTKEEEFDYAAHTKPISNLTIRAGEKIVDQVNVGKIREIYISFPHDIQRFDIYPFRIPMKARHRAFRVSLKQNDNGSIFLEPSDNDEDNIKKNEIEIK